MTAKKPISLALFFGALVLTACAAQDPVAKPSTQDEVQAVRDFIDVQGLAELSELKSGTNDSWDAIGEYFLVYEGRRETYLVEFDRRCYELNDNSRIVADERWSSDVVRARFDTIRGCRIKNIYALSEEEANEIRNIGESPGSRN